MTHVIVYTRSYCGHVQGFNGKDRFIEVQKEKYKDSHVKVENLDVTMQGRYVFYFLLLLTFTDFLR